VSTTARRIAADRGVCIASENCLTIDPDTFYLGEDGLVRVRVPQPLDVERAARAVAACPVAALTWIEAP
jgi:ferredoxin